MPFKDIQDFINALFQRHELKKIAEEVSHDLEISEITDRVSKMGGPALLFENVKGYGVPVLTNAFGSTKRMQMIFDDRDLDEIGQGLVEFFQYRPPKGLIDKLRMIPKLGRIASSFPKIVKDAPCHEEINDKDPDLNSIPVLKCWPKDGGRFITLPAVFTKNPKTGIRNVGMYRMQVYNAKSTGMHWHTHKGGALHYRIAQGLKKRLEVAVAIGPEPLVTYAATAPLPDEMDEIMFAGLLGGESIEMVRCKTINIEVPASSQYVLEGYVDPFELQTEGPFGDHTGYYSPADKYPVFHLTCITKRKRPVYPGTVVGIPPMEDCFIAKATERIFLPLIRAQIPEVVDMNMPVEGVFHNLLFISIDKRYPGQAKKVINAIWGMGQMMFTKIICVFDRDVDIQDMSSVLWKLGSNIDPKRDVLFTEGPVDALDHACSRPFIGSKMGIDATKKMPEEGMERGWPDEIRMDEHVKARIEEIWKRLGL